MVAAMCLLAACTKESRIGLELVAEGMSDGTKMYINGQSSYWQTGDKVYINGVESTITVNGTQAYVDGEFADEDYCIVFPKNLVKSRNGSTVTLGFPDTYHYRANSDGYQILDAPMAYYGTTGSGKVIMHHLTGALNLEITGHNGLQIDEITISVPSEKYVMNGNVSFDLSDLDNNEISTTTTYSSRYCVKMLFDETSLILSGTQPKTVQVPIPVMTGNVHFRVTVVGHYNGTKSTFTQTQITGGHLGRAVLANAAIDMSTATKSARLTETTVNGTPYYKITSPADFKLMSELVYNKWQVEGAVSPQYDYANYLITANLDMTNTPIAPIMGLKGIFDGGGKTITNLTVDNQYSGNNSSYWGLFINDGYYSHPSQIRNFTINGLTITGNGGANNWLDIGGIISDANYSSQTLNISNVIVTNLRIGGEMGWTFAETYQHRIGGIVGFCTEVANITNCSISFAEGQQLSSQSSYSQFGGVFGYFETYGGTASQLNNVEIDLNDISANMKQRYGVCASELNNTGTFSLLTATGTVVRGNLTAGWKKICTNHQTEYDGIDASGLTINGN